MTTAEWIMTAAVLIGPIAAVLITVWLANRSALRDQRLVVLRMLIATRHAPSDPSWQTAINLIPIEFHGCSRVIDAHQEFMKAVSQPVNDGGNFNANNHVTKSTRLIFEIANVVKFSLRETDLQTEWYSSIGWGQREEILIDSRKAMRDIAKNSFLQSRLLANAPLTPEERQFLGFEEQ